MSKASPKVSIMMIPSAIIFGCGLALAANSLFGGNEVTANEKTEVATPEINMARFDIIESFRMFDHVREGHNNGFIIKDRENPALCFLYVKQGNTNGSAAITRVACGM